MLGLRGLEGSAFVRRSLLMVAAFSVLQLGAGHRMPAFEGPASVTLAAVLFAVPRAAPRAPVAAVGGGLLISGAVLLVLAASGALGRVRQLYTPFVNGTFLVLLAGSVGWAVTPGAVAGDRGPAAAYPLAAAVVVGTSLALGRWGRGAWRSASFLVGFLAGLGILAAAGTLAPPPAGASAPLLAAVRPALDPGVAVPVAAAGLLVALNHLATAAAVAGSWGEPVSVGALVRGMAVTALSHAVQGVVPGVGTVAHAESAALVARRRDLARPSLLLGCLGVAAVAAAPPAVGFLLRLPAALARDVLLAVMASIALAGLEELRAVAWTRGRRFVLAAAWAAGLGLLPGVPGWLPTSLRPLAASPVLAGVAVALVGEVLLGRAPGQGRRTSTGSPTRTRPGDSTSA